MNALFGDIAHVTALTVTLTDGRTARFDPADARSPALASLVENLRLMRNPVYLELDPASAFISRVRIPDIVRIESLTDASVTFTESHARHTIDRNLAELLRANRHQQLAVTTNDAGEIVDVRPYE